ncbi:MAG: hypothetical protein H7098_03960 [Oligoflexus sp.]|nr:hypothetical protein [Pseudopedobacter sp.]
MKNYEEKEDDYSNAARKALVSYQSCFESPVNRLSVIKGGLQSFSI